MLFLIDNGGGGGGGGGPNVISANVTLNVPTDYPTINAALNYVRNSVVFSGVTVTINVESALLPTITEQLVFDSDELASVIITNDGNVTVDTSGFANITTPFGPAPLWIFGNNSKMPTLSGNWLGDLTSDLKPLLTISNSTFTIRQANLAGWTQGFGIIVLNNSVFCLVQTGSLAPLPALNTISFGENACSVKIFDCRLLYLNLDNCECYGFNVVFETNLVFNEAMNLNNSNVTLTNVTVHGNSGDFAQVTNCRLNVNNVTVPLSPLAGTRYNISSTAPSIICTTDFLADYAGGDSIPVNTITPGGGLILQ